MAKIGRLSCFEKPNKKEVVLGACSRKSQRGGARLHLRAQREPWRQNPLKKLKGSWERGNPSCHLLTSSTVIFATSTCKWNFSLIYLCYVFAVSNESKDKLLDGFNPGFSRFKVLYFLYWLVVVVVFLNGTHNFLWSLYQNHLYCPNLPFKEIYLKFLVLLFVAFTYLIRFCYICELTLSKKALKKKLFLNYYNYKRIVMHK